MLTIILIIAALLLLSILGIVGFFLYIRKKAQTHPKEALHIISKIPGLNKFVSNRINKMVSNDPEFLDEHLKGNPHSKEIKEVLQDLTPEETMQILSNPEALSQKVQAHLTPAANNVSTRKKPNRNKNRQSKQARKRNRR